MRSVARDRTTVVIAHRLQTARLADRIAVLDHGRVAEIGTHDELLARDGGYARMWQAFEFAAHLSTVVGAQGQLAAMTTRRTTSLRRRRTGQRGDRGTTSPAHSAQASRAWSRD